LYGICGAKSVRIREILGKRSDFLGWKDLVPRDAKLRKQPDRADPSVNGELSLADESGEGAPRFERCAPPHHHALQLAAQPAALCGRRL
jgi:hypothetical protein